MNDPTRKIAMIAIVNSSLRRRSGVRNARTNALSTSPPAPPGGGVSSCRRPGSRVGCPVLSCRPWTPSRGGPRDGAGAGDQSPAPATSSVLDGSAGGQDLLPGGGGDLLHGDGQLDV